ncbi:MAG TPA: hypothetical protein PLV92_13420, partial [Pirellulaceae bacterium]|nr:hypothetical protein [Pirellulaceae bacterium]
GIGALRPAADPRAPIAGPSDGEVAEQPNTDATSLTPAAGGGAADVQEVRGGSRPESSGERGPRDRDRGRNRNRGPGRRPQGDQRPDQVDATNTSGDNSSSPPASPSQSSSAFAADSGPNESPAAPATNEFGAGLFDDAARRNSAEAASTRGTETPSESSSGARTESAGDVAGPPESPPAMPANQPLSPDSERDST